MYELHNIRLMFTKSPLKIDLIAGSGLTDSKLAFHIGTLFMVSSVEILLIKVVSIVSLRQFYVKGMYATINDLRILSDSVTA